MENAYTRSFPIRDDWKAVPTLCQQVFDYLHSHISDDEVLDLSTSIVGELAENVIKYADWKSSISPHLQITINPDRKILQYKISNPIDKTSSHAKEAYKIIDYLKNFETATEAYNVKVLRNSEKNSLEFQTGLLQVASYVENRNGKGQLEVELDDNSVLHITATAKLSNFP